MKNQDQNHLLNMQEMLYFMEYQKMKNHLKKMSFMMLLYIIKLFEDPDNMFDIL